MNTIPNLRKNVKTRISPLKHLGFRMDGKPINPRFSGSYEAENSYTFQVQGTGKPFTFNILDSIESVTLERIIPGYSDNIGSLTITIEDKVVQFCDRPVEVRDSNGVLIGLDISVGAFIKDSTAVSGRRNVLENASDLAIFHNIGCDKSSGNPLLSNSFFLCPTSISCEESKEKGVAIAMVLDRSGSMMDFISPLDTRIRIVEAKEASTQFEIGRAHV